MRFLLAARPARLIRNARGKGLRHIFNAVMISRAGSTLYEQEKEAAFEDRQKRVRGAADP